MTVFPNHDSGIPEHNTLQMCFTNLTSIIHLVLSTRENIEMGPPGPGLGNTAVSLVSKNRN